MMESLFTYTFAFLILAVFFAMYHIYDYENELKILGTHGIYNIDANKKKKSQSALIQELTEKGAPEEEISQFKYHQKGEMIFAIVAIVCAVISVGLCAVTMVSTI